MSTNENVSAELSNHSDTNLHGNTISNMDIAKDAESSNKSENKDLPTKDKDEETSESTAVIHSIVTSAIDNVTAISISAVETEIEKNMNEMPTNDGGEKASKSSAVALSIDDVSTSTINTSSIIEVENATKDAEIETNEDHLPAKDNEKTNEISSEVFQSITSATAPAADSQVEQLELTTTTTITTSTGVENKSCLQMAPNTDTPVPEKRKRGRPRKDEQTKAADLEKRLQAKAKTAVVDSENRRKSTRSLRVAVHQPSTSKVATPSAEVGLPAVPAPKPKPTHEQTPKTTSTLTTTLTPKTTLTPTPTPTSAGIDTPVKRGRGRPRKYPRLGEYSIGSTQTPVNPPPLPPPQPVEVEMVDIQNQVRKSASTAAAAKAPVASSKKKVTKKDVATPSSSPAPTQSSVSPSLVASTKGANATVAAFNDNDFPPQDKLNSILPVRTSARIASRKSRIRESLAMKSDADADDSEGDSNNHSSAKKQKMLKSKSESVKMSRTSTFTSAATTKILSSRVPNYKKLTPQAFKLAWVEGTPTEKIRKWSYYCLWPNCGHRNGSRWNMEAHLRKTHLSLPKEVSKTIQIVGGKKELETVMEKWIHTHEPED